MPPANTLERLLSRTERSGDCWIWTGPKDKYGYGRVGLQNKVMTAHRAVWILTNGPIPEGLQVCHDCPSGDNPACVNPSHMFLGTKTDNQRDMANKSRSPYGEQNWNSKLTEAQVREIRSLHTSGLSARRIALTFPVSHQMIDKIVNGESWRRTQ